MKPFNTEANCIVAAWLWVKGLEYFSYFTGHHLTTDTGLYIKAGGRRISPASLPGFAGYFHCFTSLNMSRRWTHNRLLFTKLRLLKNLKKTLSIQIPLKKPFCFLHKFTTYLIWCAELRWLGHCSLLYRKQLHLWNLLEWFQWEYWEALAENLAMMNSTWLPVGLSSKDR